MPPPAQSDEVLLLWQDFLSGHKQAWGLLAEKLYPSLYRYATRFCNDRGTIEDTIQDMFLQLWEKRTNLGHITSAKSYLLASLRNNLIRSRTASLALHNLPHAEFPASEEVWAGQSETDYQHWLSTTMDQTLLRLSPRQREALYLRYYENMSYEEIAAVMGLQRQAVANYLHAALTRLRDYWQQVLLLLLLWLTV